MAPVRNFSFGSISDLPAISWTVLQCGADIRWRGGRGIPDALNSSHACYRPAEFIVRWDMFCRHTRKPGPANASTPNCLDRARCVLTLSCAGCSSNTAIRFPADIANCSRNYIALFVTTRHNSFAPTSISLHRITHRVAHTGI